MDQFRKTKIQTREKKEAKLVKQKIAQKMEPAHTFAPSHILTAGTHVLPRTTQLCSKVSDAGRKSDVSVVGEKSEVGRKHAVVIPAAIDRSVAPSNVDGVVALSNSHSAVALSNENFSKLDLYC